MEETVVVSVRNLAKSYTVYKKNGQKIMQELFGVQKGETIEVLKDISFDIHRGERVAIIGDIGSGRSTILRIISGIIKPDSGTVEVNGDITPVLYNRIGFEPSLSGTDNIRLKGTVLGWDREMIEERMDAIAETADLSNVITHQMKSYPKGAASRLGFVMNTEIKPDIFIYGDSFAFGGKKYIKFYIDRLKELMGEDSTLIMAFQSNATAKRLCTRGIVIENGMVCFDGKYSEAVKYFNENCSHDPLKAKLAKQREEAASDNPEEDSEFDF